MFFFIVGLLSGAQSYSEAEILALQPGRRIAWTGRVTRRKGAGEFNRAEWEVALEPQDGATRLTQRFRYIPQTGAARNMLAALDAARGIERACAANLARLKAVLERGPRP